MSIKNLFKTENVNNSSVDLNVSVPKVIFENLAMASAIGHWLSMHSDQAMDGAVRLGACSEGIYRPLGDPLWLKTVSEKKLEEIAKKFGMVLKLAGVSENEICVLSEFDREDFSFKCHLRGNDSEVTIKVNWGSMEAFSPIMIVENQNEVRTYNYLHITVEQPTVLKLQSYVIKEKKSGNTCTAIFSESVCCFGVNKGNYTFSMDIEKPNDDNNDFCVLPFRLKNEEQLQQYLLGLPLPCDINRAYKRICESYIDGVPDYPKFVMKVVKRDGENYQVTDEISLSNGQLKKFTVTKNGRTITIGCEGNWSYDSPFLGVSQNNEGNINYRLNSTSSEELANVISPFEQFTQVSQEVDDVRKLTMTMFGDSRR